MCGRFALTDCEEKIIYSFGIRNSRVILNPRYNISRSEKIPVILEKDGLLNLEFMKWGLIPFWSKLKTPLINARIETLKEKPSFKHAINKRRCLVPSNGFYEWKKVKSTKQPYFISMKNNYLFAFASIWEEWTSNDGEKIKTCAIVTRESNSFMSKIHNRMPLIFNQKNFGMWFNSSDISLKGFHASIPSNSLQAWEVTKKVNSSYFDNQNCVKKIADYKRSSDEKKLENQGTLFD